MRVYQFRHLGVPVVEGSGGRACAGTGLNDARTIRTVPILCQRTLHFCAGTGLAVSAHASRTFLNAVR